MMPGKSKELKLLEELSRRMKGVLDSQAVLRDGLSEVRGEIRAMSKKMDEIETNSEVTRLSLRRKINIEELDILEKKVYELEQKLASIPN